jgi:hypothetical protein
MAETKEDVTPSGGARSNFEREVKIYEVYRDYIKHEDTLRGQRTGSLLTIQGFLFAAWGVSLTVQAEHSNYAVQPFQVLIAIAGILVSTNHWLRYSAQNKAYKNLEDGFARLKSSLERTKIPQQSSSRDQSNEYWITRLPELRYAGAPTSKWLQRVAYHNIFIVVWFALLLLNITSIQNIIYKLALFSINIPGVQHFSYGTCQ